MVRMMVEWISVKDRLPEKSGSYLVVGKSGGAYVTHFWEKSEYNREPHFSSRYVTHWAERPDIPERPKLDKVEVVRCKNCIFFVGSEYSNVGHCSMWNKATIKDGYCYHGETESVEDK